ncbi:Fc.00g057580.m01.CDS01 [Cosmosporella sp. VM-42]
MVNIMSRQVLHRLRSLNSADEPPNADQRPSEGFYDPTAIDIAVVRIMMCRGKRLPPDLVDTIFDHAEYWAHSSNEVDFMAEHQSPLRINGSSSSENKFILRSYPVGLTGLQVKKDLSEELAYDMHEAKPQPLAKEHDSSYFTNLASDCLTPKLIRPVRKVVFSMKSKDQGWGGESANRGTYKGSWTWFEAGLERFDAEQECDAQCTYDVRFKSASSKPSPLPVCALRPLQPEIERAPPKPEAEPPTPRKEEEFDESEDDDFEPWTGSEDPRHDEGPYQYKHPLHPIQKYTVQKNKTATRAWQEYKITWRSTDHIKADSDEGKELEDAGRGRETGDGNFVRDLKMGDVITLWGKARFGAWINHIERAQIDVYWAV